MASRLFACLALVGLFLGGMGASCPEQGQHPEGTHAAANLPAGEELQHPLDWQTVCAQENPAAAYVDPCPTYFDGTKGPNLKLEDAISRWSAQQSDCVKISHAVVDRVRLESLLAISSLRELDLDLSSPLLKSLEGPLSRHKEAVKVIINCSESDYKFWTSQSRTVNFDVQVGHGKIVIEKKQTQN